jgi:hypothetical protein
MYVMFICSSYSTEFSLISLVSLIADNFNYSTKLSHFLWRVPDPSYPKPCTNHILPATVNAMWRTSCLKPLFTSFEKIPTPTNVGFHFTMHYIHGSRTLLTVGKSFSKVVGPVFTSESRSVNTTPVSPFMISHLFFSGLVIDNGVDRSQQRISVALLALSPLPNLPGTWRDVYNAS